MTAPPVAGVAGAAPRRGFLPAIALAWVVAGTIDIAAASIYYPLTTGTPLVTMYQGIASGLFGLAAFSGGVGMALVGLVCHYTIACIWTIVYFVGYPRARVLRGRRWLSAISYGVFVSVMMNLVVVPLSRVPARPFSMGAFVEATIILIFTIGTPLTVMAGRYYADAPTEKSA